MNNSKLEMRCLHTEIFLFQGRSKQNISAGWWTDVIVHEGNVLALQKSENSRFYIAMFNNYTWEKTCNISVPCSKYSTLQSYGKLIFIACFWDNSIYKMYLDDTDNDFETIAEAGVTVGNFRNPYICDIDSEGRLLVADRINYRLQLYSVGVWHKLQLLPQPRYSWDAVYVNGTLYVARGYESYYLTMYTCISTYKCHQL